MAIQWHGVYRLKNYTWWIKFEDSIFFFVAHRFVIYGLRRWRVTTIPNGDTHLTRRWGGGKYHQWSRNASEKMGGNYQSNYQWNWQSYEQCAVVISGLSVCTYLACSDPEASEHLFSIPFLFIIIFTLYWSCIYPLTYHIWPLITDIK